MCAPSRPSPPPAPPPAPTPPPAPAPTPVQSTVRRTGKTLRSGSPSQRGRGVFIRSRSPLGVDKKTTGNLGNRQSLLVPIEATEQNPLTLTVGGY